MAAEEPISVITKQSTGECIAVIQNDIRYIKETIDEIKSWKLRQEEILSLLQKNCNREERWGNIREQVDDHEVRITRIERAKCPKLTILEDHESRIETLESTHDKDEGESEALKPLKDHVIGIISIVEGAIILFLLTKIGIS